LTTCKAVKAAKLGPSDLVSIVGIGGFGQPEDNVFPLPIFETVLRGIQVIGSLVGTREDLAEVFELHAGGRTRVVLERRELEQVNECFADVLAGNVPARLVLDLR
jgi:propanol-preferring alcohol dehydrogenase